jgi:hypothetical protein
MQHQYNTRFTRATENAHRVPAQPQPQAPRKLFAWEKNLPQGVRNYLWNRCARSDWFSPERLYEKCWLARQRHGDEAVARLYAAAFRVAETELGLQPSSR